MANAHDMATVAERLDYVIGVCKYPTQTEFAAALGEKSQTLTNWRKRNSIGRAGGKLRATTGVSTDWMSHGVGEPFPNGPILYSGTQQASPESLEAMQRELHQLTLGIIAVIDWIGGRTPAEAQDLLGRLTAARKQREAMGERPALLRSLEVAVERSAAARKHRNPRKGRE